MGGFVSKVFKRKKKDAKPDPEPSQAEIEFIDKWARDHRLYTGNKEPIIISDLVSKSPDPNDPDTTLQWVHLVMAGGGMLGVAHVGFMRVLETAGVRFLGIGGTSAGAINAALTAAVRKKRPDDISWKILKKTLDGMPFSSFEDGSPYFVKMRKRVMEVGLQLKRTLFSLFWHRDEVGSAYSSMGLHKGDAFLKWLKKEMGEHEVTTTNQLLERMQLTKRGVETYRRDRAGDYQKMPVDGSWTTGKPDEDRHHYPLRLVASEVATQSMVLFPRDADLFYSPEASANPADFVRASMSVPIFFQPFTIPYIDSENKEQGFVVDGGKRSKTWTDRNDFQGEVPSKVVFCDGGTLSNFPIHVFVSDEPRFEGAPLCATIGVRLSPDRTKLPEVKDGGSYLSSVFDTSRNLMDREFMFKNSKYTDWVATVNTSGYDWLAFDMSQPTRNRLMLAGMRAAKSFLEGKVVYLEDGAPRPPGRKPDVTATPASKPPPPAAAAAAPAAAETAALAPAATPQRGSQKLSAWAVYKAVSQLQDAAQQAKGGEFTAAARTVLLQNLNLNQRFEQEVAPAMDFMETVKDRLEKEGFTWAYGAFLSGCDEKERQKLLHYRRVTQAFWRDVQAAYEPKDSQLQLQVITDDWWTNNWIGRGRKYRLLVEPLDIANWYRSNFHVQGKHYIDVKGGARAVGPTLEDEIAVDNSKRPGRYLMLQRVEAKAEDQSSFGLDHMQSSLDTARWLKDNVGTKSWEEFAKEQQQARA